jgi:hypothetical protein
MSGEGIEMSDRQIDAFVRHLNAFLGHFDAFVRHLNAFLGHFDAFV